MAWIPAAITGGASIISGILGNSAQKRAAQDQQANNNAQLAIMREQMDMARELQKQGLATQVDANGNMTFYDKATNTWKTVLSPTQQKIQDLSDGEKINQLQIDAPVSRAEKLTQAIARQKMGGNADMARLGNVDAMRGKYDGNAIGAVLGTDRERAINEGFDKTRADLATQALRSGASGFGSLAGALSKQRAQAIAQTRGSPIIEGIEKAAGLNSNAINDSTSNYDSLFNQFTGGGFGSPNLPSPAGDLASSIANAQRVAAAAGTAGGSLFGSAAPLSQTKPVTEPTALQNSILGLFANGGIANQLLSGGIGKVASSRTASGSDWKPSNNAYGGSAA